jgi:hypothetical protein
MGFMRVICCDVCNTQGIRFIDRRGPSRSGEGRRCSDGRSFVDGTEHDALAMGWRIEAGRHICPACQHRIVESAGFGMPHFLENQLGIDNVRHPHS